MTHCRNLCLGNVLLVIGLCALLGVVIMPLICGHHTCSNYAIAVYGKPEFWFYLFALSYGTELVIHWDRPLFALMRN